jgi:hypothetical protein
MAVYPTKYGLVYWRPTCKSDWSNIESRGYYVKFEGTKNQERVQRDYNLKLQRSALRSFLAAEKKLGFQLKLTGSHRTCEFQRACWESDPQRFAHPNEGVHTHGLAIDVHTGILSNRIKDVLKAHGWKQSRPVDEPWHFSFKVTR